MTLATELIGFDCFSTADVGGQARIITMAAMLANSSMRRKTITVIYHAAARLVAAFGSHAALTFRLGRYPARVSVRAARG